MPDLLLTSIRLAAIVVVATRSFAIAAKTRSGMTPTAAAVARPPAAPEPAAPVVAMTLLLTRQT